MKSKTVGNLPKLLAATIAIGLFCLATFPRTIRAREPQPVRAAVVLVGTESYTNGQAETLRIYVSSSSQGAPQIPAYTSMGDAIAVFLNEGFRIEHAEGLIVYMIK